MIFSRAYSRHSINEQSTRQKQRDQIEFDAITCSASEDVSGAH